MLFLDEVGEMSLRMQALFLRFLETGELQTVGAGHTQRRVDVRVITATNRNLLESVAARKFREDLYYRLNVLHLHIAPLRDRQADIPVLFDHYLQVYAAQNNRPQRLTLSPAALDVLQDYPWPGNIRELKNIVEWLVSRGVDDVIEPSHLPNKIVAAARPIRRAWRWRGVRARRDARRARRHVARADARARRIVLDQRLPGVHGARSHA